MFFDIEKIGDPVAIMEGYASALRLSINASVRKTTEEALLRGRAAIDRGFKKKGRAQFLYTRQILPVDQGPDARFGIVAGWLHSRWWRNPRSGKLTRSGTGRGGTLPNDILYFHTRGGDIVPGSGKDWLFIRETDTRFRRRTRLIDFGGPDYRLVPMRKPRNGFVVFRVGRRRGRPRKSPGGSFRPSRPSLATLRKQGVRIERIGFLIDRVHINRSFSLDFLNEYVPRRLGENFFVELLKRGYEDA